MTLYVIVAFARTEIDNNFVFKFFSYFSAFVLSAECYEKFEREMNDNEITENIKNTFLRATEEFHDFVGIECGVSIDSGIFHGCSFRGHVRDE